MASILNVDQINNAAGTSAVTIDASTGKPSFPNGAVLPAGSVLQVVQATTNTATTSTSTSFTDTALTASITPSSASNKIVILTQGNIHLTNNQYNTFALLNLLRGSTQLMINGFSSDDAVGSGTGPTTCGSAVLNWVDTTHASTSALTYKVQVKIGQTSYSASATYNKNIGFGGNNYAQMILMEIAG